MSRLLHKLEEDMGIEKYHDAATYIVNYRKSCHIYYMN